MLWTVTAVLVRSAIVLRWARRRCLFLCFQIQPHAEAPTLKRIEICAMDVCSCGFALASLNPIIFAGFKLCRVSLFTFSLGHTNTPQAIDRGSLRCVMGAWKETAPYLGNFGSSWNTDPVMDRKAAHRSVVLALSARFPDCDHLQGSKFHLPQDIYVRCYSFYFIWEINTPSFARSLHGLCANKCAEAMSSPLWTFHGFTAWQLLHRRVWQRFKLARLWFPVCDAVFCTWSRQL